VPPHGMQGRATAQAARPSLDHALTAECESRLAPAHRVRPACCTASGCPASRGSSRRASWSCSMASPGISLPRVTSWPRWTTFPRGRSEEEQNSHQREFRPRDRRGQNDGPAESEHEPASHNQLNDWLPSTIPPATAACVNAN
jgi:hypothetical protein